MRRSLFAELRRRNVFRAALLYLGAVWALTQGIAQLTPVVAAPEWAARWFLVAAIIGFPFWIAFAWFFEFTPEGLKRESEVEPHESITHHTGRKLDFAIIGVMAVAIVLLLTDRFVLRHGVNQQTDVAISEKSIAVLPFVNMSSDKEQEYFSDGISEELLNLLAKIPALHVAARTSSFSFKGKDVPIPEIAKTLHVAHMLEGSIRKSGDQVRITAQLIRAADGYHLWSETYDRKLDDIFKIQDEVAAKVVEQLKVSLLGAAPKARTTDPRAYALYLQAVQLGRQQTAEAFRQSDALFQQVLAIDPRYAPAWDELSRNYGNEANAGLMSQQEGLRRSREAIEKAVASDPDYAPAHASLGWKAMAEDDLAAAARHFDRALALGPTDIDVLRNAAYLLLYLGRLNESVALQEVLATRDPVNVKVLRDLGVAYILARRFDEGTAKLRTVLNLAPGRAICHYNIGVALLFQGQAEAALVEMQQETSEVWRMIGLPMAFRALGREAEADAALTQLVGKYEKDWSYNVAYIHAFRGETDKAFEWLDKAVQNADTGLGEIPNENLFDKIHADPRWLPFLRKIGKAPEQLAKIEFKVALPQAEGRPESGPAHP